MTTVFIRKNGFASLTLATLFAVTLAACGNKSEEAGAATQEPSATQTAADDEGRLIRVQTEELAATDFTETVTVTGSVEALEDATLSARSGGTIVSLLPLGRSVGTGGTIAAIDAGLAEAGVSQAQAARDAAHAQYNLAEDTFKRQQPLYRDSVISPLEFEQVRSQLAQAKAQYEASEATLKQVQEQLAYTRVVAPFSGTVEEHLVQLGEQVSPGVPVARIVSTRKVKVTAGIPERYSGEVKLGANATIRLDSYGMEARTGKVTFVGSAIDEASRTFPIEIELFNSDGALKPEMIATVDVTRGVVEDAIVIMQSAVLRDEFGNSVYVVDRASGTPKAERKPVTLGPSSSGRVVITDGLAPGEELIVVGQSNVAPGDALEIEEAAAAQGTY
ncbi:MAG: efflux RND transporter periplasmic adaptor subunit [Bacteroidetes bacterium]|nr:efflux RND transporter periplasmic adaptor subunit [Bacteroidota bacterium]